MNSENQTTNNFNLPQPVAPQAPSAQPPVLAAPPAPPASPMSALAEASAPMMPTAQDGDKIEGEWVRAVESLTRQFINDPHQLSEELTKLKARYMRERYGKEMKAPGGQGQ